MSTVGTFDGVAFGAGVLHLAQAEGWTQEEVAWRARVPLRTVGDLMRGKQRRPSYDVVKRVADTFGRPPEEIEALGRRLLESSTPGLLNPTDPVPPPSAPSFPLAA